jgi:antitoxin component YwqK of YwqJK toxin-antitoxin module
MEEDILCYICYEPETKENSYVKEPPPCICKGSILIHKKCLQELIQKSRVCSICKTKYKVQYLPNINGLELITKVAPNGDIAQYTVNESGQKHGIYSEAKQSGEIVSRTNYENGLLHGEYKTWYLNGQLECHCYCLENRIEGEFKSWYQNGKLQEQSFYKNGLKDGIYKKWDINGKKIDNALYVNGIKK